MKLVKFMFALLLLLASAAGQNAWADRGHFHHGRAHVGVYIAAPLGWPLWYGPEPYYYPYPYRYYPYQTGIVEPAGPTVYIEKSPAQAPGSQPSDYWYYCNSPDGYYPYVKECPGGWKRVTPEPPAPRP